MAQPKPSPGTAWVKRNCWSRGKGEYSMKGELKRGISLNKRYLNRKVRCRSKEALQGSDYKRICKTFRMVDFT